MNLRLLCKLLGMIALLIGVMMMFSLPWAFPRLGYRKDLPRPMEVEWDGIYALAASIVVCFVVGGLLLWLGRKNKGKLYRKEAMAVVGLSWIMSTVLGALPFYFAQVSRGPAIRLMEADHPLQVFGSSNWGFHHWIAQPTVTPEQHRALRVLRQAGAKGLTEEELQARFEEAAESDKENSKGLVPSTVRAVELLTELRAMDDDFRAVVLFPEAGSGPPDREMNFRIRWIQMGVSDCLFESQSGFSTTGATVISDLEDPVLIPHCILFWRSSTHFLGGLGIIVLFVVILGQGSAGKALMRAEMPGPTKEGATARMQHTAWIVAAIYLVLNLILSVLLWLEGMSVFDAICHAFGTMATGGFSTYNASLGHFDSALIEYTVIVFMTLAATNFTLLYFVVILQPAKLLRDVEWRTYMSVLAVATLLIVVIGLSHDDFEGETFGQRLSNAVRYGLFQVVSIMTTTGYGTHDFDLWSSFGRGMLFLLMFVGGCAGSTGGGLKVIRHILFLKVLRLEIEQSFRPRVVRPLRLSGKPVDDPDLRKNILVYFGLILAIFVFSWMFVVAVEPDITWGATSEHKLIDSASGIAATLNNIGPGLGTVGATQNYGHFSPLTKILFTWLMMIGRLEIFAILVLFVPSFWRNR